MRRRSVDIAVARRLVELPALSRPRHNKAIKKGLGKIRDTPFDCAIKPKKKSSTCNPQHCFAAGGRCLPPEGGIYCRPFVLNNGVPICKFWSKPDPPMQCKDCRCEKLQINGMNGMNDMDFDGEAATA